MKKVHIEIMDYDDGSVWVLVSIDHNEHRFFCQNGHDEAEKMLRDPRSLIRRTEYLIEKNSLVKK